MNLVFIKLKNDISYIHHGLFMNHKENNIYSFFLFLIVGINKETSN
jgi:hypothetical protein